MNAHLPSPRRRGPAAVAKGAVLLAGCAAAAALTGGSPSPPRAAGAPSALPPRPQATTPPRPPRRAAAGTTTTNPPPAKRRGAPPAVPPAEAPVPAASCSVPHLARPAPGLIVGRVTAIGDSVMIDLEPYLEADVKGIVFDAVVGQQWYEGVADAQQLRASGQLGSVVVVELGTNGPITSQLFAQMMQALQGTSRVVFVNNYVPDYWQDPNNAIIGAGAERYRNVVVVDWAALAAANPGWLCADHTHLSCGGPGASELAALVSRCV